MRRRLGHAPWAARVDVLIRVVRILDERKDEIVEWIVRESGGTRLKAELEHALAKAGTVEATTYPSHLEGPFLKFDDPSDGAGLPAGVFNIV
jgi:acyl-CoA reductase-like NAD-dependent aldehyde dehydrogenase